MMAGFVIWKWNKCVGAWEYGIGVGGKKYRSVMGCGRGGMWKGAGVVVCVVYGGT